MRPPKDATGYDTPLGAHTSLSHSFPLRDGLVVQMRLPLNLTRADADRLSGFFAALAFPDREEDQ